MSKISKAVFSIALITCPTQVMPITPTKALLGTLTSGILGGSIGGLIEKLVDDRNDGQSGFAIGAGLTTLVTGIILYKNTPYRNFRYAQNLINKCKNDSTIQLITESKKIDNELIDKLREEFITSDFPIIRSSFWLEKLRRDLFKAIKSLKTAQKDRYWDTEFVEDCKNNLDYAYTTINLIDNILSIIKKDSEYSLQRKAYEDKIESRKLRREIQIASHRNVHNSFMVMILNLFDIVDHLTD